MLCYDCPRMCGVDREKNLGFCGEENKIRVAKIIENFKWEEPCISGNKGALAIFFSGCNLRCNFCQNYEISHKNMGKQYSPKEFRELIEKYDLTQFSSIDLITPSHFSSLLCESFENFSSPIPIVWNSSGYENTSTIDRVSKFVDVFLPDFKYFSNELSMELSHAPNYFNITSKAVLEMVKNKPNNIFNDDGILCQGVLIRHLVLPSHSDDSLKILDFVHKNIQNPLISLMCQFTPTKNSSIKRNVYPLEYKIVLNHAISLGLDKGYMQDFSSANENFIPEF